MQNIFKFFFSIFILYTLFFHSLPNVKACGPGYLEAVFEYKKAPENPYKNFAAGKIGILKPTYPRTVLYAAYRYLNGGGFSAEEQKSLVEVWNAYFNKEPFEDNDVSEAVKKWVEKRKTVIGKEEKTPEIYVERTYGGYDFFPNCTKNAFEVAAETLGKRISSYGSTDKYVKDWILTQDKVFQNCANGKRIPASPDNTMPEWLQKDRQYQIAAAEFYSLNFDKAKEIFSEISQDSESPWQETAAYLVGRALIRKASLSKNKNQTETIYVEAEQELQTVAASGGKYADSAEDLIGLIKYRVRPEERVRELAQNLSFYGGENFRQNLIDYSWLLDNFETEALKAEEKRKEALKSKENIDKADDANKLAAEKVADAVEANSNKSVNNHNDEKLQIRFYSDDYRQSWEFTVNIDAADEEIIAEAEKAAGQLSDKMKERVIETKNSIYQARFSENQDESYQGGYHGDEKITLEILPNFLRSDDLSDWLFTFQIEGDQAYHYSLLKYRQSNSDLWLLTALSKADKNSAQISELLKAAENVDRLSAAYPTVAFHKARILLEQNKQTEVRIIIDEILNSSLELPISTRNKFLEIRMGLSETLEDFLRFSLRKPFTLSQNGYSITIDEEIARQKSFYDPEYYKESRAEYEQQLENEFRAVKEIEDKLMLDYRTADIINQNFPLSVLAEVQKSNRFPEYLRVRLAKAIWTRAVLLDQYNVADKILVEFEQNLEESAELFQKYKNAKTKPEKQTAALFIILKNKELSPYLSSGLGYPQNTYSGGTMWWCVPEDEEWDDNLNKPVPRKNTKPDFLKDTDRDAAQNELKKLRELGNASIFLTEKVLEWAKRSPKDERIPESLYIVYEANDWDKYGCGGDFETRKQVADLLKRKYPNSFWAQKIVDSEN